MLVFLQSTVIKFSKNVDVFVQKLLSDKKKLVYFGLIILFLATFILRFINLGYSEFQDDEKKTRIVLNQQTNLIDFFLSQRKGPMQFLVAYVPLTYFQSNGYVNEFAVRLPFTVANFVTVFVLYALILKLTKSHLASFFVAFLFLVNGFVVGFSRIAQYQNLNLLFSITSLYCLRN